MQRQTFIDLFATHGPVEEVSKNQESLREFWAQRNDVLNAKAPLLSNVLRSFGQVVFIDDVACGFAILLSIAVILPKSTLLGKRT